MSVDKEAVYTCAGCGHVFAVSADLDADIGPCPKCGCTRKRILKEITATSYLHPQVRLKGKSGGRGKPFIEQVIGDDLTGSTGRWSRLVRVIDVIRKWYFERVTDSETGKVIHECSEPLSQHIGHGSAKVRKKD